MAIDAIGRFVKDMSFELFYQDRKTVDAVVRNLQVIGEAARALPEHVRQQYPDIPWNNIVGMRSVLVHEYFGVDFDILWTTIQVDLPPLRAQLQSILDERR
jgi:uncharacterized protein with HEPN domain